jgi:Domain of Unknown Function (DUF928)
MKLKKCKLPKFILALIIAFAINFQQNMRAIASLSIDRLAQQAIRKKPSPSPSPSSSPSPKPSSKKQPFRFILPNEGASGNREGAATRGFCPNDKDKPALTAIIPGKNMGLTITDRPTFWFYLPYQPSSTTPVKFTLKNAQDKVIYQQNLQLTNTPGVIGVTLPANAPALEVDKTYEWKLVACDADSVIGRIKRVKASAEVMSQLQANTGRDRILIYAENGFWYDTLTELIALHRQNSQDKDFQADWENLLKSDGVNLANIASEPIVSCCEFK